VKLSFKKQPRETGLRAVAEVAPSTTIKADGKACGEIRAPHYSDDSNLWSVGVTVKADTGNPNCDWKWIFFKKKFASEPEAREFVKTRWQAIQELHTLHLMEDYG